MYISPLHMSWLYILLAPLGSKLYKFRVGIKCDSLVKLALECCMTIKPANEMQYN